MDLSFLPKNLQCSLKMVNLNLLYEIRIRKNAPIKCVYDFKIAFLGTNGITLNKNASLILSEIDIFEIIRKVSEYSIYKNNDNIKECYITYNNGIRIGIAGECVYENGTLLTIKNFTSLIIRIPHYIKNAGQPIYNLTLKKQLNNILIISPPRCGKTTILKDLIRIIDENTNYNILVIDERNELILKDYQNVDCIKNSTKNYAFKYGLRSLSPEIVITDELSFDSDWDFISNAINSGVKIIATAHASTIEEVRQKEKFSKGLFDFYVILDKNQIGNINKIYDKNLNEYNN